MAPELKPEEEDPLPVVVGPTAPPFVVDEPPPPFPVVVPPVVWTATPANPRFSTPTLAKAAKTSVLLAFANNCAVVNDANDANESVGPEMVMTKLYVPGPEYSSILRFLSDETSTRSIVISDGSTPSAAA